MSNAQGPLVATQRVEFPHLDGYVELRSEHWPNKIGYEIEYGSLRFGHRGTWGRDGISEAVDTFSDAIAYMSEHWKR